MSGLLLLAVGALLALGGCRAFEPEAIIVNKAPETFIIGAPLEHAGGYYKFHVYWYGSDADGRVERFVWALTDTTVQDEDTTEDEEDVRFNPALDASTLEIANWTTRTDSVFNFTIDQGVSTSADMTLHMVAIDDFGDYDRTPARLHFFSNTLGNPEISFFKVVNDTLRPLARGVADTVGYRRPYEVAWRGSTPNIRGFGENDTLLARLDTVPPVDGLFGYKWQLQGAIAPECIPSIEDCWRPRRFVEATGDSVSFFGSVTGMNFTNDGTGSSPFRRLLPSGRVGILVNSIDVAGVEVANFMRGFDFVVNYDPDTYLLQKETFPTVPADPDTYPYYIRLNDTNDPPRKVPFGPGDRIPDRTYVVFKALAKDDIRDGESVNPPYDVGLSGFFQGVRRNFFGGTFSFSSESSRLDTEPGWETTDGVWYGDTLGFLTAPSSEFTISMQAVDEHGRKDGTPPSLSFEVGFEPYVQCVEILPKSSEPSAYPRNHPRVTSLADLATNSCFQDTTELTITAGGFGPTDLEKGPPAAMLINKSTGFVRVVDPTTITPGDLENNYQENADIYYMTVLLHGEDDEREAWDEPVRRIAAWQYEIRNECDIFNEIRDGGGNDDLEEPTWGEPADGIGLEVDPVTGLWKLTVEVAVPSNLILFGPTNYQIVLASLNGPEAADLIFNAVTKQFGLGYIDAVALDQTTGDFDPIRPACYNLFRNVRPPVQDLITGTWRDCVLPTQTDAEGRTLEANVKNQLSLGQAAMSSLGGEPVRKYFRLTVVTAQGDYVCGAP